MDLERGVMESKALICDDMQASLCMWLKKDYSNLVLIFADIAVEVFRCLFLMPWAPKAKGHFISLYWKEGRYFYIWFLHNSSSHTNSVKMEK